MLIVIIEIIAGFIFSAVFLVMAYLIISIISLVFIRVPYVNTPLSYIKKITPELGISSESVVYDLGCGNGDFLLEALKFNPKKCVGFEIAPIAYASAILNTFLKDKGKISLRLENFLKADLSVPDILYIYLIPRAIAPLESKLKCELRPGAKFVCVGSHMPNWTPIKEIILKDNYKAYIYQK
ncbi:MAG: class I SAM-dependent methyltransferase [Candidatus Buchananbacteria bacterium]